MTCSPKAARAIVLAEVLGALSAGTMIAGVVIATLTQTMYLHRAAAAHLDRQASVAALTRQLRSDACAAATWHGDDAQLVFENAGGAGRVVAYQIDSDQVTRTGDGQTETWRARGLSFSAHVEAGSAGDVLQLETVHTPQTGGRTGPITRSSLSFLLPKGQGVQR